MSLRKIAPFVIPLLVVPPAEAHAEVASDSLSFMSGILGLPAAITSIGSGFHLLKDEPRLGWPIGSFVTGGLSILWGSIATMIVAGDVDRSGADVWAIALTPIAVGLGTISLGVANVVKRTRARRKYVEEVWVLAPILLNGRDTAAPGLGAAVRFD